MGFIESGSTVSVVAHLTDAGKRKLFDSLENRDSGFVTKFSLGDSDSNYNTMELGTPILESGHVPSPSNFKPKLRSSLLYQGTYRPSQPVMISNGESGPERYSQWSIGSNEPLEFGIGISTEWPRSEVFDEDYDVTLNIPGNISEETFNRLFTIVKQQTGYYTIKFSGGATIDELNALLGSGNGGSTTVHILLKGKTVCATIDFYINLKQ